MDMPNLQPNRSQLVNALRDTAQSASNMVAENVSVPIDAIAWALRKAGVPVDKPMFGSDWMNEKGLTPKVEQSGAKVIGDTIGMLSPLGFTKQGAKALIDAGSAVKNMPVGMSVKNVGDDVLTSVNPTGTVFTEYTPQIRATQPLGKNIVSLAETMGVSPDELMTIYRGAPSTQKAIVPGDFVTDIPQLAKDYAGSGRVIEMKVRRGDVLDQLDEPMGGEYIYRPSSKK